LSHRRKIAFLFVLIGLIFLKVQDGDSRTFSELLAAKQVSRDKPAKLLFANLTSVGCLDGFKLAAWMAPI
jgi:hypothetical protein